MARWGPNARPPWRSLRLRIAGSFFTALLVMSIAQALLIWQHAPLRAPLRLVVQVYLPLSKQVARLVQDQERMGRDLQRMIDERPSPLPNVGDLLDIYGRELRDDLAAAQFIVQSADGQTVGSADAATLSRMQGSFQRIGELVASMLADATTISEGVGKKSKIDEDATRRRIRTTNQQLGAELDRLSRALDDRVTLLTATTEQRQAEATRAATIATMVAAAVAMVLLLFSLAALRPIGRLTSEVARLAAGETPGRVEVVGLDEVGLLAREFNAMAEAIEARDQRLAAQARSERLALIGQMLAQITHEVRNPLNAMSLNAEMLGDELVALDPDGQTEAAELLGLVRREIARLTDVTGHYLQLARRPPVKPEPCEIRAIVREVARLLEPEVEAAGAALVLVPGEPAAVLADPNQVRQALHNIVRNALEAGALRLQLSLVTAQDGVELVLDDDGPGMDETARTHAIDPFFSTKAQGTGLGLAIVRQILDDHGGYVQIEASTLGGTRVALVWPAAG